MTSMMETGTETMMMAWRFLSHFAVWWLIGLGLFSLFVCFHPPSHTSNYLPHLFLQALAGMYVH